ncbi:MAG: RHS repeat-associated core domain-containing protein [Phycisphaerales bacterium]
MAVLNNNGALSQQVRYSAYGVPYGLPAGDTNADGSIVATADVTQMNTWASGPYDVRGDLDLDGDVDAADVNICTANFGLGLGWNKLAVHPDSTLSGVKGGHRKGYCGYEHDLVNHSVMHVRNRVYFAELGRWTRRDPLGYVDGMNLYAYVAERPIVSIDSTGLMSVANKQCEFGNYQMLNAITPDVPPGGTMYACVKMDITRTLTRVYISTPPAGSLCSADDRQLAEQRARFNLRFRCRSDTMSVGCGHGSCSCTGASSRSESTTWPCTTGNGQASACMATACGTCKEVVDFCSGECGSTTSPVTDPGIIDGS